MTPPKPELVANTRILDCRDSGTLLLCFSHLRWDFVFQRPQHLLTRAAGSMRVIFVEEPVVEADASVPRLARRLTPQGVTVAVPHLPPGIETDAAERIVRGLVDAMLAGLTWDRLVLWFYTPMALPLAAHLPADVTVYDCMDELSAFRGAPKGLILRERALLRRADLVFTGGRSLYQAKRALAAHVHAFPSSVDSAHFLPARAGIADPAVQAGLARPRLGYFGVIDERMDLDLVNAMAERRPEWQFVMLGPVVKIDPASLPRRPNIAWLGQQPYAALPAFLANWDVGLMPFALNEATRFISPTKTPEFLAAGLPVVSTAIADVVTPYGDDGLVEIACGALAAIAAAERVMARPTAPWLARVDRHLSRMSWDRTWAAMAALIEAAAPARDTAQVAAGVMAAANA
jgi:UDP-galactopyranose mutase